MVKNSAIDALYVMVMLTRKPSTVDSVTGAVMSLIITAIGLIIVSEKPTIITSSY